MIGKQIAFLSKETAGRPDKILAGVSGDRSHRGVSVLLLSGGSGAPAKVLGIREKRRREFRNRREIQRSLNNRRGCFPPPSNVLPWYR